MTSPSPPPSRSAHGQLENRPLVVWGERLAGRAGVEAPFEGDLAGG
jgi:hypothetical protein